MYLFGLEGSGFIISLGLILLISGAIMFYCLKRFSLLENSIIDQGRILQSFIMKMQIHDASADHKHIATDIAINSALEQSKNSDHDNISTKIEVSDNEFETDSESNSDDNESNTESVSESGDDSVIRTIENLGNKKENNLLQDINLEVESDILPNDGTVKIISIEDLQHGLTDMDILNINSETSESNSDNSSIKDIESLSMTVQLDKTNETTKKKGFTKMKVAELRTMVFNSGLVDNMDFANKIKKENLIKMLQEE